MQQTLKLTFLTFIIFISTSGFSQVLMGNGTTTTCSGNFYDSGGSTGNYSPSENYTRTICSGNGAYLELTFNSFILAGGETFNVYNASSATGTPIFSTTSAGPTGSLSGTSGCLTIVFTSNSNANGGNGVAAGWNATISCASPPDYIINGDAEFFTVGGQTCIELTSATNDQTGCAWSGSQIDFNSDFSLSLDYYFGSNPSGADGTTFTFQPSPGACGSSGAQLGAGGISNSLIIEFDTYDNDGSSTNDLSCDHIAVEIDGDLPDDPSFFPANQAPYCGPTCAIAGGGSIENGSTHAIEIAWNATTNQLEIFFDGNSRLTCTGDFINTVFGGQNIVYWGATAATGGLNNQQYFCPQTVIILPSELSSFTSICSDEKTLVNWTSVSENDLNYYTLEYSFDGLIYFPFSTVQGQGNSTDIHHYSVDISSISNRSPYLRLKMVDFNGDIKNTEIIKAIDCSKNEFKVVTQSIVNNIFQLHSKNEKDFSFELIDIQGKKVIEGQSTDGNVTLNTRLSKGIYIVNIQFINTNYFQQEKLIAY